MVRHVAFGYNPFAYDSDDSLYSDYLADRQFEHDFPHGVNNDEWTTEDGRTLKITEMTTRHIQNCMKMLEREATEDDFDEFYYVLEAELNRRRENAARQLRERQRMEMPEEVPF